MKTDRAAVIVCSRIGAFIDGDVLRKDSAGAATIQFENGVTAHALLTLRNSEWETICEGRSVTCWNNGWQWHIRKQQDVPGWRTCGGSKKPFRRLNAPVAQQI